MILHDFRIHRILRLQARNSQNTLAGSPAIGRFAGQAAVHAASLRHEALNGVLCAAFEADEARVGVRETSACMSLDFTC